MITGSATKYTDRYFLTSKYFFFGIDTIFSIFFIYISLLPELLFTNSLESKLYNIQAHGHQVKLVKSPI